MPFYLAISQKPLASLADPLLMNVSLLFLAGDWLYKINLSRTESDKHQPFPIPIPLKVAHWGHAEHRKAYFKRTKNKSVLLLRSRSKRTRKHSDCGITNETRTKCEVGHDWYFTNKKSSWCWKKLKRRSNETQRPEKVDQKNVQFFGGKIQTGFCHSAVADIFRRSRKVCFSSSWTTIRKGRSVISVSCLSGNQGPI